MKINGDRNSPKDLREAVVNPARSTLVTRPLFHDPSFSGALVHGSAGVPDSIFGDAKGDKGEADHIPD